MSKTLIASFETRRQADMAVERLVQEYGIERTDIFVSAEGDGNTSGKEIAGSDASADAPSTDERHDAALAGRIAVSVDIEDDAAAAEIKDAFSEFDAEDVSEE